MDWKTFTDCLLESAITSANTLFIIGTSTLFTYVLVKEGASLKLPALFWESARIRR